MFNVKCPQCKRICHQTTETYSPDIRPNGSMVELLDPWKGWGWGKFGDDRIGGATVLASGMHCPLCLSPLAPSGRLMVIPLDEEDLTDNDTIQATADHPLKCPVCGRICKNELGLKVHVAAHLRVKEDK